MRCNELTVILNEKKLPNCEIASTHNYPKLSKIKSTKDVYEIMKNVFKANILPEEHVWIMCLNPKLKVIGIFPVGHGSMNSCAFNVKGIMMRILLCNAHSFIIIHNHPSGDLTPSPNDILATQKLFIASSMMDIDFNEHIIISPYGYMPILSTSIDDHDFEDVTILHKSDASCFEN